MFRLSALKSGASGIYDSWPRVTDPQMPAEHRADFFLSTVIVALKVQSKLQSLEPITNHDDGINAKRRLSPGTECTMPLRTAIPDVRYLIGWLEFLSANPYKVFGACRSVGTRMGL